MAPSASPISVNVATSRSETYVVSLIITRRGTKITARTKDHASSAGITLRASKILGSTHAVLYDNEIITFSLMLVFLDMVENVNSIMSSKGKIIMECFLSGITRMNLGIELEKESQLLHATKSLPLILMLVFLDMVENVDSIMSSKGNIIMECFLSGITHMNLGIELEKESQLPHATKSLPLILMLVFLDMVENVNSLVSSKVHCVKTGKVIMECFLSGSYEFRN